VIRLLAAFCLLFAANAASAQSVNGNDADACDGNHGSAIKATIVGLKDRAGRLKLELYPGTQADFLKDDRDLVREGKFFRRIWSPTPQSGAVILCIRAPRPGRYALLFTHDRDGQNKFNFWKDGAGFPANTKLGRSRPKVDQALITVGSGVTNVTIRAQYLRGLGGFSPIGD
jgi:uncharacterized protein (DUF2141 family)